ncbi:hypothetical protein ACLQ3B_04350 [Micromonospora sp. DT53]|uniref:hypothetical protein n=1 Tax=Micromonospora sp. DT53 TaxID=3393444 RepID=UPI003CEC9065
MPPARCVPSSRPPAAGGKSRVVPSRKKNGLSLDQHQGRRRIFVPLTVDELRHLVNLLIIEAQLAAALAQRPGQSAGAVTKTVP